LYFLPYKQKIKRKTPGKNTQLHHAKLLHQDGDQQLAFKLLGSFDGQYKRFFKPSQTNLEG
jgi:hypothetical protein